MKPKIFIVFWFGIAWSTVDAANRVPVTFQHSAIVGAPADLKSLDVYSEGRAEGSPVLVFVHGGGWVSGNKSNVQLAPRFLEYFEKRGMVVVSVGFRLVADGALPGITFREQTTDIAAALKWVATNIRDHKGDSRKIILMGYSAGAHLVALLSTDETYLRTQGLDLSVLKGVIALDVNSYDIPQAIVEAPSLGVPVSPANLRKVFSSDLAAQQAASPISHVRVGRSYSPTLVIYTGTFDTSPAGAFRNTLSKVQSERFVAALRKVGAEAQSYGDLEQTHRGIMRDFGTADDGITVAINEFLDRLAK